MNDRRQRSIIATLALLAIAILGIGIYVAVTSGDSPESRSDPAASTDPYWDFSEGDVPPDLVLTVGRTRFPSMETLTISGDGDKTVDLELTIPVAMTFECDDCTTDNSAVTSTKEESIVDFLSQGTNISLRTASPSNPIQVTGVIAEGPWTMTITDLNALEDFDGELSGRGDGIYYYTGDATQARLVAPTNLPGGIIYYSSAGDRSNERLIDEMPVDQIVDIDRGIIHIKSHGEWTLTPEN